MLCAVTGSPLLLALSFLLHCVGATLVNISSGSLRIAHVPKNFTARVNTSHSALVASGQMLGSLFLIPVLSESTTLGAVVIIVAYLTSLSVAYALFPKISLSEALKVPS